MRSLLLLIFSLLVGPPLSAQARPSDSQAFAALSAKADGARDANQLDEAAVLYTKALALRPGWVQGWWSLGTIQYDRNAYTEAARAFQEVIALEPKTGTARVMLGLCEFELGQEDSALKHIEEGKKLGIDKDPQLRRVMFYHEGVLLQRKAKFETAQDALEELCYEGDESREAIRTLGMVQLRIRARNSLVDTPPGADIVARLGRAGCLAAQKKFDEARQDLGLLVSDYPDFPNIHYAYGRFLLEAHDTTHAVEEFEREIKNDPGHVFARLEIAAVKYRVDSPAGLPYAVEAVRLDPKLPFGHYLLGLLLLDSGNYQKAIPELEIALKGFPEEAKVYFALGAAYARAGRKQDAARARAAFVRLNNESSVPGGNQKYERNHR